MEGRITGATILILCSILLPLASAHQLSLDFYNQTCPQAEQIVREVVTAAYHKSPGIAAGLIRLIFHDCFVQGCDASILLDTTPTGERVERESPANSMNMRGLDVINAAKARLEEECPGTVSCADTLVFAARDSAALSGVPYYQMPGGRRDSLSSRKDDVDLPSPSLPIEKLVEAFEKKGMTRDHLVILSGAHSIGEAHCTSFAYRVNGYNESSVVDPKLCEKDIEKIKSTCQGPDLAGMSLPLDSHSVKVMDSDFYKQLLDGRGLLESDRAMSADPWTRRIVEKMANDERRWLKAFSKAMVRLGEMDVKTGFEGEIRRDCRRVNFS